MEKRLKVIYPVLFFLLLSFLQLPSASGQYYNTIFWMNGIPQSSYSNVAMNPQPRLYIGMPGISSHYTGFAHTGFALQDFLRKDDMGNFYWDEDNLIGKLKNRNFLTTDMQHELLAFGFLSGRDYFSFNATEKVGGRFGYSGDFMTLLIKGNNHFIEENREADFSGVGMDFIHYREFAAGYSRQWTDNFSAGLRAKVLFGMSNVWFERNDFSLHTDPDSYALLLNADMIVNVSSPSPFSPIDSLSNGDFDFDFDATDYALNTRNMGFALDFGMVYNPTENLTMAFSALDLGFIDWRDGVENFTMSGAFEFDGVDLNDFFDNDDENGNGFEELLDSLKNVFDIKETALGYRSFLGPKFFLSAGYDLSPKHKLGLLGRADFYQGEMYPSFTASYNFKPFHAIGFTLAYSVMHWNYSNIGVGLNLNLGPLQIYAVADNVFWALQPHTLQTANIHLGVNWVFGYRPRATARPLFSW